MVDLFGQSVLSVGKRFCLNSCHRFHIVMLFWYIRILHKTALWWKLTSAMYSVIIQIHVWCTTKFKWIMFQNIWLVYIS